jgi:hypothetical protein
MNIVTLLCYIIMLGMSIMAFIQWHEPHCQLTYLSHDPETDHQLTNELVWTYTRDSWLFNTTHVSVSPDRQSYSIVLNLLWTLQNMQINPLLFFSRAWFLHKNHVNVSVIRFALNATTTLWVVDKWTHEPRSNINNNKHLFDAFTHTFIFGII